MRLLQTGTASIFHIPDIPLRAVSGHGFIRSLLTKPLIRRISSMEASAFDFKTCNSSTEYIRPSPPDVPQPEGRELSAAGSSRQAERPPTSTEAVSTALRKAFTASPNCSLWRKETPSSYHSNGEPGVLSLLICIDSLLIPVRRIP